MTSHRRYTNFCAAITQLSSQQHTNCLFSKLFISAWHSLITFRFSWYLDWSMGLSSGEWDWKTAWAPGSSGLLWAHTESSVLLCLWGPQSTEPQMREASKSQLREKIVQWVCDKPPCRSNCRIMGFLCLFSLFLNISCSWPMCGINLKVLSSVHPF